MTSSSHLPTNNICMYELCIMWMLISLVFWANIRAGLYIEFSSGNTNITDPPYSDSCSENANTRDTNMDTSF
jgi:hypothetical protein